MQEKLIIFLETNDLLHPSWALLGPDSLVIDSAIHDSIPNLAKQAIDKEVIVLVPAEDVLLLQADLPKMGQARLMQALPFVLEEQLVADIETLHFVPGEYQANGKIPVAVAAKEKMQQWLALLKSWSIRADVMTSSVFALPYDENTWHVLIKEIIMVRTGLFQGFAGDKDNLNVLLEFAFTAHSHAPELLYLHNYTQHAYASQLAPLSKIKEDFIAEEKLISNLAKHIAKHPGINLLKSAYTQKKSRFLQLNKVWTITAYLALAWVFLLFLYPMVSYFILRSRVNGVSNQIEEIYMRNFPQAKTIIAPKLRMEEKLKLSNPSSANKLLILLGFIGKGIINTPSIKLNRLDFQNNQLTLQLNAATSQDFANFTDFLTQQGLSVKQQNADLTGAQVNATLLIE